MCLARCDENNHCKYCERLRQLESRNKASFDDATLTNYNNLVAHRDHYRVQCAAFKARALQLSETEVILQD